MQFWFVMKVGVAADVYIVYKEFERAVSDKKNLTFVTKRWLSKFTFGFHLWFLCYFSWHNFDSYTNIHSISSSERLFCLAVHFFSATGWAGLEKYGKPSVSESTAWTQQGALLPSLGLSASLNLLFVYSEVAEVRWNLERCSCWGQMLEVRGQDKLGR